MSLHRGNLFLVGLMGAGKTTLGRQLARRLDKRFVDADHELEARLGVTIPTIFEIEGEAGFRDREEAMHRRARRACRGVVLATGGGAVLRAANRARLRENGTVLYLHAEPETLWQRTAQQPQPAAAAAADPRDRARRALRSCAIRSIARSPSHVDRIGPRRGHALRALARAEPAPLRARRRA